MAGCCAPHVSEGAKSFNALSHHAANVAPSITVGCHDGTAEHEASRAAISVGSHMEAATDTAIVVSGIHGP